MEEAPAVKTKNDKFVKTLIIGAGIAGLSAANHLVKNNDTNFVVLEAKDKIGGRISSFEIQGEKLDLGANRIHGVLGNPMYEIAMAHNLIDIVQTPKPHKVVAALEDGKQVPFSILQEIFEAYSCFLHRCEEYFLCQYEPPEGINSVGEHINLEAALYLDKIPDETQKHVRSLIFQCLLKRESCISGCDNMNDIDLLELGSYVELQGGNISLPKGYSSILNPIVKLIPPEKLLLNHEVTKVTWADADADSEESDDSSHTIVEESSLRSRHNSDCPTESQSTPPNRIEVVCNNGVRFIAETVICSLPLGVLKNCARTLFSPPLPDYKLEAIDRLLFGTVNKIFLVYDRPFLNTDVTEVLLLWNQTNDEFKEDLSSRWFKKIYSFSKVSETLLLGWISGKEAEYMETLSSQEIGDTCTDILRKFLNDPFIPKPKLCVCSQWHSDKYSQGSYTAMAVGATQFEIEQIKEPLYSNSLQTRPAVLFVGEHTHTNFYSTVHGAYLTGRNAAQFLIDCALIGSEIVVDCKETADLSSFIQGMSLQE
nr:PREDICTED: peroxisomal N(1)-acetyl-spermine/spermidine oxidase isoform X1 [Bemisia tabaci]